MVVLYLVLLLACAAVVSAVPYPFVVERELLEDLGKTETSTVEALFVLAAEVKLADVDGVPTAGYSAGTASDRRWAVHQALKNVSDATQTELVRELFTAGVDVLKQNWYVPSRRKLRLQVQNTVSASEQ
jgi:hypothetical protein